ncbi:MAG: [protein-PII] uridylyltransferase, partial [Kutzneria sp.]|nr:[protein-PII] uridylyltransferase [Kutzneria sp.]
QDGDDVAAAVGMRDRFELAKALSAAGRTVGYAVDVALRSSRAAAPQRGLGSLRLSALRRGPVRRPLDDGVVLHGNEVALARDAMPSHDPGLMLRVALAAAQTGTPIAEGTLNRLADAAPELRKPWPRQARDELIGLLGSGQGLVDVVEALDRVGLWGRLFPEWGAVRDLPPRDPVHTWTVDRHLVEATVRAARLATSVSRPDLLLLAALLHDIGKGRDRDHSELGAELAAEIGARLGLWPNDVDTLAAAVRHHLLLPHTATRRDVTDPATIDRVTATLGGDPVLLELLHALAEADSLATAPGGWTEWKAALVADLVQGCRTAMAGEPMPRPEPLDADQRRIAETVAVSGHPEVSIAREGEAATVTVVAPDRPGLLSRAAGVLALNSLAVHSAAAHGHRGVAVEVFGVSPRFGSFPDAGLLREQLTRSVHGGRWLAERLAGKERDYGQPRADAPPPKTLWFDDEATGAAVLELRAVDRIGLLHGVAAALEECELDVRWARVATMGGTVIDSFCLATADDAALTPTRRRQVERAVLAAAKG